MGGAEGRPHVLVDAGAAEGFEARARREVWSGGPSAAHLDPERPADRSARAKGGAYVLLSPDGVDSTADWRPSKGRPTSILFRRPLETCVTACERDHALRFTNEVLARSGSGALAAPDPQGDAVAWKRRRF